MDKKFKVGLIRVLTTEDEEVLSAHGKQIMSYFPELQVETKCIRTSMREYTVLNSVNWLSPKLLKQLNPSRMLI